MLRETWDAPSFNWGYHVMIGVIGASFTAEYLFKGLYEGTVGAVTAWWATSGTWQAGTREDRFIQEVAKDYSSFIHATPWYEYPFGSKLTELWNLPGQADGSVLRRWERRFELTLELLFKTAWGWVIKQGSTAGYDPEAMTIQAWVRQGSRELSKTAPDVKVLDHLGGDSYLLSIPRYEPFKQAVQNLVYDDAKLVEVAGNEFILMSVLAPKNWRDLHERGRLVCEWALLTEPERKRVAFAIPVARLHEILPSLDEEGIVIDHLYDF